MYRFQKYLEQYKIPLGCGIRIVSEQQPKTALTALAPATRLVPAPVHWSAQA